MRQRAQQAGNLNSTPQQTITTEGQNISIEPSNPDLVYLPAYDPWLVYGAPLAVWPGWYPVPGLFIDGPSIEYGPGFGIGLFGGFGWGWNRWGFDWRNHRATFNHAPYVSHSRTFINRHTYADGRSGFNRAPDIHAPASSGVAGAQPGFSPSRSQMGTHSGAFSGFDHGGTARMNSFRGHASFGGGIRGGGGGFRGAGGGGGRGGAGGGRR